MKALPLLTFLIFVLFLTSSVHGHADTIDTYVTKFEKAQQGEHLIVLRSEIQDPKSTTFNILLKPQTENSADGETDFPKAAKVLKKALADKTRIKIGRMSSLGFNPIKNRPGFYRSESIEIVDWFGVPVVCFFHSTRYIHAPE